MDRIEFDSDEDWEVGETRITFRRSAARYRRMGPGDKVIMRSRATVALAEIVRVQQGVFAEHITALPSIHNSPYKTPGTLLSRLEELYGDLAGIPFTVLELKVKLKHEN